MSENTYQKPTINEFTSAARGLLNMPGVTPYHLMKLFKRYLNDEDWLYSLPDSDFDRFIALVYQVIETIKTRLKEQNNAA